MYKLFKSKTTSGWDCRCHLKIKVTKNVEIFKFAPWVAISCPITRPLCFYVAVFQKVELNLCALITIINCMSQNSRRLNL